MADMTPMKKQYGEIKAAHRDCLLFFRLGDFYEMFDEDARVAARELDLVLTTRDRGKPEEEQTPMCGVPYHSAEAYISRLISKGYKVAVCEQTEDPLLAHGLVQRAVVRVISPGTVIESSMLEDAVSNYLAAVYLGESGGAAAFCDISTGEVCLASFAEDAVGHLLNELARFRPREAVLSPDAMEDRELHTFLAKRLECRTEAGEERFSLTEGAARICTQYGLSSPEELGAGFDVAAVRALGGLLSYLSDMQKTDLPQLRQPDLFTKDRYMELDNTARRTLELTENLRTGEKKGSLLWVLDKTKTPMGGRLLRAWTERPLLSPVAIRRRLSAVDELHRDSVGRSELIRVLKEIGDIQRLLSRAVCQTANGRDMLALGRYLENLPALFQGAAVYKSAMLREIAETGPQRELQFLLYRAVCDEPPFSVREGGILRAGYSEEVDRLRDLRDNGARRMAELEAREKERTGIRKLKVGYNKVFGYYIDIPNSAGAVDLPEEYIRKQTLANGERYFTPELKELENSLLSARDSIVKLEYELFLDVLRRVAEQTEGLQRAANAAAELDALCSLAETAAQGRYVCPEIELSRSLHIVEGRHPVVERMLKDSPFVPNDTLLNDGEARVAIVTGPNMAGKSTYLRQTALIVLMAQMGSFVPAKSARIGIVDRVFTRIGASDDLAAGQSTFMVEMTEVAGILRYATADSLLILDEIGRGTSTYDGMAIARAVLEYCADKRRLGAKTMFATHYHELTALEESLSGVRNLSITAKKRNGALIFLRKIVPGAADDSYGIEVAMLAGVPDRVVSRAKEHLRELEADGATAPAAPSGGGDDGQLRLTDVGGDRVVQRIRALHLDGITPFEALSLLYELKKEAEG